MGRPGADAVALLRSLAPTDPDERSQVLGTAWQSLSVSLLPLAARLGEGLGWAQIEHDPSYQSSHAAWDIQCDNVAA